jgi:hypothetical protein
MHHTKNIRIQQAEAQGVTGPPKKKIYLTIVYKVLGIWLHQTKNIRIQQALFVPVLVLFWDFVRKEGDKTNVTIQDVYP